VHPEHDDTVQNAAQIILYTFSIKWRVPGQEVDQRKLGERLWKDCKARGLNREHTMDRSRWRKQIGIFDDHDGCEWVNVSSGTSSSRLSQIKSKEL